MYGSGAGWWSWEGLYAHGGLGVCGKSELFTQFHYRQTILKSIFTVQLLCQFILIEACPITSGVERGVKPLACQCVVYKALSLGYVNSKI